MLVTNMKIAHTIQIAEQSISANQPSKVCPVFEAPFKVVSVP